MKTRPPATTGELCPSPTACRQTTGSEPCHGSTDSCETPSRFGPRHCGQSAAKPGSGTKPRMTPKHQRCMTTSTIKVFEGSIRSGCNGIQIVDIRGTNPRKGATHPYLRD